MTDSTWLDEGYKTLVGYDPAEDSIGPFYYKDTEAGLVGLLQTEAKHANANGTVHGGVLMTFADYALCMAATDAYKNESCVTVNLNNDFVAAAIVGDVLLCHTEVTRKTGSMVFVRGKIVSGDSTLFTYSAIVKRLIPRDV